MLSRLCCWRSGKSKQDDFKVAFSNGKSIIHIGNLPEHLTVNILRKMSPVAFARTYRATKYISLIVEDNKKGPRIMVQGRLYLQFIMEDAKMLLKFQSSLKTFKKLYDFDEFLDSMAKCSYFHFKSIWFLAHNFDEDFFYLILMHIQKRYMKCTTLTFPNNDHLNLAISTLMPKELSIIGEEIFPIQAISQESMGIIESLQFDCSNGESFEELYAAFPYIKRIKIFVNNITDYQKSIVDLIKKSQNGTARLQYLVIEYNIQYNRVFKLAQLLTNLEHIQRDIHFPHGIQSIFFFPLQNGYLVMSAKVEKKHITASDLFENISLSVVNSFPELLEFIRRVANIEKGVDSLKENGDIASIESAVFQK